jgi:uncharacterized membrane protein YphA (DoxX/SURF4 family)
MSQAPKFWITTLRWVLGLAILVESCEFVFSDASAHHVAKFGLPQWIRPVLGGFEILAALLFLVPVTGLVGGYLLVAILLIAALLHLLHGQFDVSGLIVYAVAVMACMPRRKEEAVERSR